MLKRHPFDFCTAIVELGLAENICDRSETLQLDTKQIKDTKANLKKLLQQINRLCHETDLSDALEPELARFRAALRSERFQQLAARCDHLRNKLLDELGREFYLKVPRQEVIFYQQKALFGEAVAKKFPKATSDLENAGNCLALQQPTACVFHLMRAMEIAVQQLGRRLNVTITPQTTWRQMTAQMDPIIRGMPNKKSAEQKKKNKFEEAIVNLHHVGSVWRNNTMHPAASYTQNEARDVFNAIRVFMNGLSDL